MARKSGYTTDTGDKIVELMASGASLRDIAEQPGMPDNATISRWGRDAELSDPEFPQRYARARDAGTHAQFEQLRDLEQRLLAKDSDLNPHNARVAIDTIKWRLSKMLPAVYGEKSHLEVSGGLKVETIKDLAPEWMQEELKRLAGEKVEVLEAGEDSEIVVAVPRLLKAAGEN